MTAVEWIVLDGIQLPSASACDMVMESLVANQAQNPALKKIYVKAGGEHNENFSDAAKAHILALIAKGVNVRE